MRLFELQLKKDLIAAEEPVPGEGFQPGEQVKNLFNKYGWNLLDHGIEGAVGEHPTKNMVLKVFIKDSQYKEFINIVKDNPNPHFPKFFKYARDIPGTKFSYILMEKLTPVMDADFLVDHYLSYMYVVEIESERFGITGLPGKFGAYVLDYIYDTVEEHRDNPYTPIVWNGLTGEPDKQWITSVRMLCHAAKLNGWRQLDLHPKNFMLRGQTLVIIDPFAVATL